MERSATPEPVRQHYERAPIIEALIEIQVRLAPEATAEPLLKLALGAEREFPTSKPMLQGNIDVALAPTTDPKVAASSRTFGHEFRTANGTEVLRARLDGFSYHRLEPYTHWEDWSPRARTWWAKYLDIARPEEVTRLAVRYVNRLNIPDGAELGEYLLTTPEVAPGLPQALSRYSMHLAIPYQDNDQALIIRQATVDRPAEFAGHILLDLEVTRSVRARPTDVVVWAHIEALHLDEIKAFERCITNRTREIIS